MGARMLNLGDSVGLFLNTGRPRPNIAKIQQTSPRFEKPTLSLYRYVPYIRKIFWHHVKDAPPPQKKRDKQQIGDRVGPCFLKI